MQSCRLLGNCCSKHASAHSDEGIDMKRALFILTMALCIIVAPSQAQQKPGFNFTYAKASFTCKTYGSTRSMVMFSNVFGACYQEVSHRQVAEDQIQNARQAANAACAGGTATYTGLDTGYPYSGPNAQASAEKDRTSDISSSSRFNMIGSYQIAAPY